MNADYLPWKVLSAAVILGIGTEGWILDDAAPEDAFDRIFTDEVNFSAPFVSKPVVHVGLTDFDIDRCSSPRLTTWRSSRVHGARFQWIAIGA